MPAGSPSRAGCATILKSAGCQMLFAGAANLSARATLARQTALAAPGCRGGRPAADPAPDGRGGPAGRPGPGAVARTGPAGRAGASRARSHVQAGPAAGPRTGRARLTGGTAPAGTLGSP